MRFRFWTSSLLSVAFALSGAISCGGDGDSSTAGNGSGQACTVGTSIGCEAGQTCETVQNQTAPACFAPITLKGKVIDLSNNQPVANVQVVAIDANGSAVSTVAATDASGNYTIQVSSTRDAQGNPISKVTLRADADHYQSYPGGVRTPFTVDLSQATKDSNGALTFTNEAITTIGLNALPSGSSFATLQGTVQLAAGKTSALVVAELPNGEKCPALPTSNCTAIAGKDGKYTLFNLPAGTYNVKAYTQGSNYDSKPITATAGQTATVDLNFNGQATATISGKVNIVNPGQGTVTSVILVLKSTVHRVDSQLLPGVPILIKGATPPGLRVGSITGDFKFEGVPSGNYLILAAYEDDFLVRDPDVCIGGTEIVERSISSGENILLDNPFKVTGSIDNLVPDNNAVVSATPTFTWQDDSSEDLYEVSVLDSFGNLIWDTTIPGVSGGTPSVTFNSDGKATKTLQSGKFYQFHIFSVKNPSGGKCTTPHAISQSEDLKGVFKVQ